MTTRGGDSNGSSGEAAGGSGVRSDESILGFFYADSAKALRELRDTAERLAENAERVGRYVEQVGVDASADVRAEFHLAIRQFGRECSLTGQLVACLDLAKR